MRITRSSLKFSARSSRIPRRSAGVLAAVALAVMAWVVAAGSADAQPVSVLAIADSFEEVLNNLRDWLVGILALIATVCLTIGGARYLIASGDPSEVEKAKTALRGACLGYALAMLAPVVVEVLKSIVGA
ncbi:pilin [Nocardia cyriacigeorgica]|uniref:pilin n=1 Tax=Nocardia cyriacigeorgica TaxID=135487 RepID=UPI001E59774B|nr:pilin [Nocardia cyriacigeorgica]